jgi:hypothetical protein
MEAKEGGKKMCEDAGLERSRLENKTKILVIPDIVYRASSHRGHSRRFVSGIHLGLISDGSPLITDGDDRRRIVIYNRLRAQRAE